MLEIIQENQRLNSKIGNFSIRQGIPITSPFEKGD